MWKTFGTPTQVLHADVLTLGPTMRHLWIGALLGALGCADAVGDDQCPAEDTTPACLGIGPEAAVSATSGERNVAGEPLTVCSQQPLTGYYRDGLCRTGSDDRGIHVVCAEMTPAFLAFTQQQGNDLSTPRPTVGFPGLRPGDRWCLCAARWEEARRAGVAPPVVLPSTHAAALQVSTAANLQAHAQP